MAKERTLIRGIISLFILYVLLSEGEKHGYALRKIIVNEFGDVPSGYIYVLLKHLQNKKCITPYSKVINNRKVKVYRITEEGKRLLLEHKEMLRKCISVSEEILSKLEGSKL